MGMRGLLQILKLDKSGWTPLAIAAFLGNIPVLELLLSSKLFDVNKEIFRYARSSDRSGDNTALNLLFSMIEVERKETVTRSNDKVCWKPFSPNKMKSQHHPQ